MFIFLLASTYWQLVRDLAESPAKIPEKVAQALSTGKAKHFFLSYVILQGISKSTFRSFFVINPCVGLGIMPLQLLNLGVIIPRFVFRAFITRTPRGAVFPVYLVLVLTALRQILLN